MWVVGVRAVLGVGLGERVVGVLGIRWQVGVPGVEGGSGLVPVARHLASSNSWTPSLVCDVF